MIEHKPAWLNARERKEREALTPEQIEKMREAQSDILET